MKSNAIKLLALAAGFILNIVSADAATLDYTFNSSRQVILPTALDASNGNGRVWLGNFGDNTTGSLLDLSQIRAGGSSLLNSFRPLTSFEIVNGSLVGDIGQGLSGSISLGTDKLASDYSVAAGQFANQPAYILAISSVSSVWENALSAWQNDGTLNAILIKSNSDFSAGVGDPVRNYGLNPKNGLVFGTYTASTITAAAVPEPSTGALLVVGALGLATLRLRRKLV